MPLESICGKIGVNSLTFLEKIKISVIFLINMTTMIFFSATWTGTHDLNFFFNLCIIFKHCKLKI